MQRKHGRLRRCLRSIWNAVDTLQRIFINIFFLMMVGVITATMVVIHFKGEEWQVPENTALVLNPVGNIVEQLTYTDSLSSVFNRMLGDTPKDETRLQDIIDVIDYAKDDKRIDLMILDLKNLSGAGLSKVQAIGAALTRFKNCGKKIIAYGDMYTQNQYYLASHANDLYLHPLGGVFLQGYGIYRLYFKDALKKLLIKFHIFRVGSYKSALEPFIRNDMSTEAKEANLDLLKVLWNHYKADIAVLRGLPNDRLDDYVNHIGQHLTETQGDSAQLAVEMGLVDALKTRDQFRKDMVNLVGLNDKGDDFTQIDFDHYSRSIRPALNAIDPTKEQIGLIVAKGNILDGTQPAGSIGGDSLADLFRRARRNDKIKAVVLRIDSGGGSAFASEVIRREVELTKNSGKPVIVSMSSVTASGGYWIASAANEIWAAPTTITGSIGIFGAFATVDSSLNEIGVHNDGVGTTQLSGGFDPTRPMNPIFSDAMQQMIENGYQRFIKIVSEGRQLPMEAVEKIAQGRIWDGQTAKSIGLVDKLGSLKMAIESAAQAVHLDNYEVAQVTKPLSPKEQLFKQLDDMVYTWVRHSNVWNRFRLNGFFERIDPERLGLGTLNDPTGTYATCPECNLMNMDN